MLGIRVQASRLIPKYAYPKMQELHDQYLLNLMEFAAAEMRKRAPVRTGHLRDSIGRQSARITKSGHIDRRSTILVGPSAYYSGWVVFGAKASQGRYVPSLGQRISSGRHPGQKPNNFIQRSLGPISMFAKNMGLKNYSRWVIAWRVVKYGRSR